MLPPQPPPPPPPPADGAASSPPPPKNKFTDYIGAMGLLFAVSFLTWYLMRQKKAAERRRAVSEKLEEEAVVCPGEIEQLRENNIPYVWQWDWTQRHRGVAVSLRCGRACLHLTDVACTCRGMGVVVCRVSYVRIIATGQCFVWPPDTIGEL